MQRPPAPPTATARTAPRATGHAPAAPTGSGRTAGRPARGCSQGLSAAAAARARAPGYAPASPGTTASTARTRAPASRRRARRATRRGPATPTARARATSGFTARSACRRAREPLSKVWRPQVCVAVGAGDLNGRQKQTQSDPTPHHPQPSPHVLAPNWLTFRWLRQKGAKKRLKIGSFPSFRHPEWSRTIFWKMRFGPIFDPFWSQKSIWDFRRAKTGQNHLFWHPTWSASQASVLPAGSFIAGASETELPHPIATPGVNESVRARIKCQDGERWRRVALGHQMPPAAVCEHPTPFVRVLPTRRVGHRGGL